MEVAEAEDLTEVGEVVNQPAEQAEAGYDS